MANPRRTRYVAPNITRLGSGGTTRYDPATGNRLDGEFNERGQPLGAPAPFATGPDPFAPRPPMATGASGVTPRTIAPAPAPRVAGPPRDYGVAAATAALTPGAAFNAQPLAMRPPAAPLSAPRPAAAPIPTAASPSAVAPRLVTPALPTHPDDRALLMATRAQDAAARAPEPISIPGGLTGHAMRPGEKPLYLGGPGSGQDSPEGQALAAAVNRANGVAPAAPAPGTPIPQLLAAAGTNRDVRTTYGIVSSTTLPGGRLDGTGAPEAPARWSDTGVTHPQPLASSASPMDMPGYYPRAPLASTAAPPQAGVPTPPPRLAVPAAATAPPPLGIPAPYPPMKAPSLSDPLASSVIPTAASSSPASANSRIIARQTQPGFAGIPQALDPVLPVARSSAPSTPPPRARPMTQDEFNMVNKPLGMNNPGSIPQLSGGYLPRKKATSLDEPANQYA